MTVVTVVLYVEGAAIVIGIVSIIMALCKYGIWGKP